MNLTTEIHVWLTLLLDLDCREKICGHVVDGLGAIDLDQLALLAVILNQWSRLLQIHLDAPGDGI
jgi:hypothetical protein